MLISGRVLEPEKMRRESKVESVGWFGFCFEGEVALESWSRSETGTGFEF